MEAMKYETLIRRAFGFALNEGRMLDRWADPASLANTDQFRDKNLAAVKVGAGYAFEILTTSILNNIGETLSSDESTRLEEFTERMISAKNLLEADQIITEFVDTVENKYFRFDNGIMLLK